MFSLEAIQGRTATAQQKEYLFFSGYSYLGMQYLPAFQQLVQQGMALYGWLHPSSRISNTTLQVFDALEERLSQITNTAATVCFSNGFAAGTAAVQLFKQHPCTVCPTAHPAINKLQQPALNFDQWAEQVLHILHSQTFQQPPVLVADAINPITGEINDFSFLQYIETPIILVVDDSHGIGMTGHQGAGCSSYLPRAEHIELVITYSLGKAFGINGGAVSCTNAATAARLRQDALYTAASAMPPAMAHAFLQAEPLYKQQRALLQQNIGILRIKLQHQSQCYNEPELPIFVLPEHMNENYFRQQNIIISSFAYPNAQGKKVHRAVLNALHNMQDMHQLAAAIAQLL